MTQWAIQPRGGVTVNQAASNDFLICAHDFNTANLQPQSFEVYSTPHDFLADSTPHKFEVKVC